MNSNGIVKTVARKEGIAQVSPARHTTITRAAEALSRRAWFVNLEDYPDGAVVLAQLREWEIGVDEYRMARVKGSK